MRLKRLEIYGFKSFADRTVVVFDEGITGIVGPNGSGKSNLSDAVRWVLGEQSAKALRGGKMEDVIFNGTQKRKRMGYCEVSLVFENEDHALSVDYTEVMITRRVYRSGEGEYYINKSACRLKDIVELFRDTGVGKEGYSIIGQGRIDEILSQKSEDRRGVFEEAAGIVKYRTRKEESEKRLSNMRDNLSRVEDIIAELESQLEPLEKASETARRYLNLRDELRVLECSAFVLRSDRAKERIAEAEQLLTGLKEAIASEEKRADALSEQQTCAGRLEAAQQNLAARQNARNEEQETIRQLTQEIDSLRETLAMDMDKCHKAELVLGRTQSELEQMQQRIWDDYELTYAGAKEYLVEPFDMAGSDKRAGDIRREIRAMGPVNVTAMEDYRACRERYDDLAGQRDDLVKAQDDLLGIIESLQRQMEKQFLENFRLLQQYLSETFVKLFGGGKAELRLMDEKDVLGCGIEIVAQPPGKKLQMLSLLSGGERALTAIAILFAMLRLKPTPFCFLDEIEAALDDGNISTFADYLRDFSKDTQFVVVTHRKGTMERCDGLYGVAMEEKGVSKMLSVELKDVSAEAME